MGFSRFPAALIFAAAVAMTAVAPRLADAQTPACAEKLTSCVDYISTNVTPPAACCGPLKEAVTNEMQCLCNLYDAPGLLASFGINVTQAVLLPGRCHLVAGNCSKASAPTSPTSNPPPPDLNVGVMRIHFLMHVALKARYYWSRSVSA
ncbi:hypothetical protein RHGRI_020122 [Rhododendron griersonianum]|uniref:Bifunctional inhibitor/plant lipid transfer protein/seed storage helical domain-containing protein n=1 Tax=Rhododendron griersonianum TaxID=479676 RepID=A0AAV6JGF7_9ERIC|nr:hypothetical protein RHGRI_020122 [Rhododendron griersonianum]